MRTKMQKENTLQVVHFWTSCRKEKDSKQQVNLHFNFIGNCNIQQKADIEKRLKNGNIWLTGEGVYITSQDESFVCY